MSRPLQLPDLDDAPCGFLIITDDGQIEAVNNTLVSTLGYAMKEDLTGRPFESILTIASRIFYQTHLYPLVNLHGVANEIFLTLQKKSGEHYQALCNAVRRKKEDTALIHCILVSAEQRGKYEKEILEAKRRAEEATKENTELIQAKLALEESSRMLDNRINRLAQINNNMVQFGHFISHEIQEPIRKIAVRSDILIQKNKDQLAPNALEILRKINSESTQLRAFAVNLERYIGINLDKEKFSHIDLNTVIRHAYQNADLTGGPGSLVLNIDPLPSIDGFPLQIESLFTSLFQALLDQRSNDLPLSLTVGGQVEKINSFLFLPGKYNYIDILRITISDSAVLTPRGRDLIEAINSKTNVTTIARHIAIASSKAIADNHFGTLTAATNLSGGIDIVLQLPVVHQVPPYS
ncbi:MAG TPA: PAS domain-containing protein [Puia sp.]|nr:PAS domain-containing protein [Puia sp.]